MFTPGAPSEGEKQSMKEECCLSDTLFGLNVMYEDKP